MSRVDYRPDVTALVLRVTLVRVHLLQRQVCFVGRSVIPILLHQKNRRATSPLVTPPSYLSILTLLLQLAA